MCNAIIDCGVGQRQTSAPVAGMTNRGCGPCPVGTFNSDPINNTTSCTACPAGTANGTTGATSMAQCTACDGASQYSAAGASACSTCGAGATANGTHTGCVCANGFYGDGTTCTAYSVNCPAPMQYEAMPRTSSADRTCGMCAPGTATTTDNQPGAGSCITPIDPDAGM